MGEADPVVNNFQIIIATVNGTGSQTANTVLLRALFKMGIPVSGKNIFPSNIQGLPTWFTIRVNKDGYIARCEVSEVLVAMNQASIEEDIEQLPPGGVCIYPEEWHIKEARQDVVYYAVPVKGLIKDVDIPRNLQDYIANMVYVGVLAVLLGMELDEIQEVLNFHFAGKGGPVNLNMGVVRTAAQWAQENLVKIDPYRVERMDKTGGKILHDGNATAALGAVFGGVSFVAWYPITPATSLMDALGEYLKELRHDPETGLATYVVVQAEDELSAIGMLIGAGWAGARAMTSTSGPGMSLMAEYSGLAYFAEVPAVVWNVQRVGPSTGLPTRTSQGDVLSAYLLGHGDTKHPVLLPG
nr:2-oxoacid:acceptor oxidoreductase family protein [Anaerolineae bacterium]